ncbi:MAG: glycosyl hydrolase family 79 C-terminal domain-containing protein [Solirubrobacteraceae bacterium]
MRRRLGIGIAVLGALAVVIVALAAANSKGRPRDPPAPTGPVPPAATVLAGVKGPTLQIAAGAGRPIRLGFLGLSVEFQAVRAYTGNNPRVVNPVLLQLIRNLSPGQAPTLRIGGDSTDVSWVPTRGVKPPPYVSYRLTPSWLATTAALAHDLGARMTMGLNLAADEPALAAVEARAYLKTIGRSSIAALEIGNEPNVYGKIQVLHTLLGAPLYARPRDYGYPQFLSEFRAEAAASPRLALAGPALAVGPTPMLGSWVRTMPDFLRREQQLPSMTVHRYPLRNCFVPPSSPQYPTVANLLSDYSTSGLTASLRRWIGIAHAQHRAIRVDELNSVACRGKTGVSDTFAASLWVTDALFSLVRAGVDGINMHTLPNSAYQLFQFSHSGGHWHARVEPVYYGLQLFAQAAPVGARLIGLHGLHGLPALSAWATRSRDGTVRVVLINKSQRDTRNVTLRAPGTVRSVTTERMQARSVHARDVTLGGRSYGAGTHTGRLATPILESVNHRGRGYLVSVPRGSAALVTFASR